MDAIYGMTDRPYDYPRYPHHRRIVKVIVNCIQLE